MGDHLKKVQAGAPFKASATAWNCFIDAARAHQAGQDTRRDFLRALRQLSIVPVKNSTGAARDRFAAVALGDPIITPTDNSDEFQNRVSFVGNTPAAGNEGKFAVLLEPAAADAIVPGAVAGVTVARINVTDADHTHGDVATGLHVLQSGGEGAALILWKESGTGEKWAIVRIGLPAIEACCWGKATATWSSGNTSTLDPCSAAGADNGLPNVTGHITSPTGGNPADAGVKPVIALNDVVAYLPFGTNQGVILNVKWAVDADWLVLQTGIALGVSNWYNTATQGSMTITLSEADWRGRNVRYSICWDHQASSTPYEFEELDTFHITRGNPNDTTIKTINLDTDTAAYHVDGTDGGKLKLTITHVGGAGIDLSSWFGAGKGIEGT